MAKPSSKPRSTSQLVATKPACAPLLAMYRTAEASRPKTWTEVEGAFVRAMEAFDANSGNPDRAATVASAHTAAQVVDGVGLFCFGPTREAAPTSYRKFDVPPGISMDRVLYGARQDLLEVRREGVEAIPDQVARPAVAVEGALGRVAGEPSGQAPVQTPPVG